jgi:hypothetical protein
MGHTALARPPGYFGGRRNRTRPLIGADLPIPVVYAFTSSTSVVPDEAAAVERAVEQGRIQ